MTREETIKFWTFRYENAKDFSDPHWEAQERREHREYVEALRMAIEALQGDMYCPNCGARLVPEDEYLEPTHTHGRLIDADALYASIAKDTYLLTDRINSRDYGMFLVGIKQKIDEAPTVQADRPHGEWIAKLGIPYCNNCEKGAIHESDFCPNCGADMRGDK